MRALLQENFKTLALAFPLVTGQLSQMLLGLTDTLMIGRVGTVDLAAAAFANVLVYIPFAFAIGLTVAVSVQVAHGHGSEAPEKAAESLRNGFLLSILAGALLALGMAAAVPFLDQLQQPPEVVAIVPPYLLWIALSFIPMLPSMVIKSFAEAKNHPWPALWIQLGGVALNVLLNYIFIFGHWGAPALGLTGAGLATCLARFLTCFALWYYLNRSRHLADSRPATWLRRIDRTECHTLGRIGTPISGQLLVEIGAFAVSALLIGQFGSTALAAHQIVITCAATTFMLPLGISMAVTIRVGHAIGAAQGTRCRRIILGAQLSAFLIMLTCATAYLGLGPEIGAIFSIDPEVIALVATLLGIVGLFQIFDGIQIISMGALRGIRDVNIPTGIVFACFWLLGLPVGTLLAFPGRFGASGVWIGLAVGLALAAISLSTRLRFQLRRLAPGSHG